MAEREPKPEGLRLVIDYVEFDQVDQYSNVEMLGGHEMRLKFRAPESDLSKWAASIGGRFRVTVEELDGPTVTPCRVCVAGIDRVCVRCGRQI